jgi:hypothetical protein
MRVIKMREARLIPFTFVFLALLAAGLSLLSSVTAGPSTPARLDQIPGSDLNRVILTPKAAERLTIETTAIRQEPVRRWLLLEGKVEAMPAPLALSIPPVSRSAKVGSAERAGRVLVQLLEEPDRISNDPEKVKERARLVTALQADQDEENGEDDDDDITKKTGDAEEGVRVTVISIGRDQTPSRFRARPIRIAAAGDLSQVLANAVTKTQFYEVDSSSHGLRPGQRVYVRLSHPDGESPQKLIPYSAVLYDATGGTWIYTTSEPLVFLRHRIEVASIEGDHAILREGPALGATVVTLGAVELLGIERKFGH